MKEAAEDGGLVSVLSSIVSPPNSSPLETSEHDCLEAPL